MKQLSEMTMEEIQELIGKQFPYDQISKYCATAKDKLCKSQSKVGDICTRAKGHEGPHIACGCYEVQSVWED